MPGQPLADYSVSQTLWKAEGYRLERVQSGNNHFLLEERQWDETASAAEAHRQDEAWKQWLTFCHHPALLLPVECRLSGARTMVFYTSREPVICWPNYIEQAFREYMADEELTLELGFRLTLIWGALVGKGLRPVSLEKPRPDMILLNAEGEVTALPPRFAPNGVVGCQPLLQGMAEIFFHALTRHEAASRPEDLPRCRDVNREISLNTQKLVTRCLPDQEEHFDTLGALTRALTQQHIKRDAERPYRDSGPLANYRAIVADRDYEPAIEQALAERVEDQVIQMKTPFHSFWQRSFLHNPRNLNLLLVVFYVLLLTPYLFVRGFADGETVGPMLLTSGLYWLFVGIVYSSYRRRNVK